MTRSEFSTCAAEVSAYTDRDAYISDMALASLWGDAPDADIPQQRIETLGQVWDAVKRPLKEIVNYTGLSQIKFARLYNIPRRTVENWCSGSRECPLYTSLLLQEAIGLISFSN